MSMRLLPGTTLAAAFPVPSEPPSLSSLESAFELQEYIALLLRIDAHNVSRVVEVPSSSGGEIDEWVWVYEHMRRLIQDINHPLVTTLQLDCTSTSCPAMKANEWQYLCTVHAPSQSQQMAGTSTAGQCCAIDYIIHTMDNSTASLNSSKHFPSRMSIPTTSHHILESIARRIARLFAHAYFTHREAFEESEAEHSVYARFSYLTRKYGLLGNELLIIPPSGDSSESENLGRYTGDLSRTETMMLFEERNLRNSSLGHEDEGERPKAGEGPMAGKTLLQRAASSQAHEAANAVEEAALTPSPAVLPQSPSVEQIPVLSDVAQIQSPPRPTLPKSVAATPHANALIIYPPISPFEPQPVPEDEEMDVVDMDIVDDADEARAADVAAAAAAEKERKGAAIEMQLGAEMDTGLTGVSDALAEAASDRITEGGEGDTAEIKGHKEDAAGEAKEVQAGEESTEDVTATET